MKAKYNFCLMFLAATIFCCVSCAQAQKKNSDNNTQKTQNISQSDKSSLADSFTVGNQKFELMETEGKCFLIFEKKGQKSELKLETDSGCKVVRDNKDKVRGFKYKDIGAEVFMVVGKVKDMSGKLCGEQAQVILLKKNEVSLGKKQNGTVCVLYGTDEKNFWMLSH